MSDRYIEKNFLYLLVISFLVHLALFIIIWNLPSQKTKSIEEPPMVDLSNLPELPPSPTKTPEQKAKRLAEKKQRVAKEIAPKGEHETERVAPAQSRPVPAVRAPRPAPMQARRPAPPGEARHSSPVPATPAAPHTPTVGERSVAKPTPRTEEALRTPERGQTHTSPADELFRPHRQEQGNGPKLFPSAHKLARLEEDYRKKYAPEVDDGHTRFLNTDDILFGSFLRRFENAVYGVWHYPEEAAQRGIEGAALVRITFTRNGKILHVQLLDSSRSAILDNEVFRALKQIDAIGSFPKNYPDETFNLICQFSYGITGSRIH